jgi:uncharacterized protein
MQFNEDQPNAVYTIQAYGEGWLQIQHQRFTQPLIVSAQTLITDWDATSFETLTAEQLKPLFALNTEVILVGCGSTASLPSGAIYRALVEHGIGFEIMATDAACRTYTILLSENRSVAAALFP